MSLKRYKMLFACLFSVIFQMQVLAGDITAITELRLVYWRSFHGEIEQSVGIRKPGEYFLTTYIRKPGAKEDEGTNVLKSTLTDEDLKAIIQFANDQQIRRDFSKTDVVLQPDGSTLELTVREKSFGLIFFSQRAFSPNATESEKALRRIAHKLLEKAGVQLSESERY